MLSGLCLSKDTRMKLHHLDGIEGIILDMDGVLWTDTRPIGDLPAIFARLKALGLRVVVATNNSTRSADQHQEKLARLGVLLEPWQVVSSSMAVVDYLSHRFPSGGEVYVIGEENLKIALAKAGFHHHPDAEGLPLAVVAGLDYALTYDKLRQAALYIRAGVPFIGTNPDRTLPTPEGIIPGAGAVLAALVACTDMEPLLMGKPEPPLYQLALERLGTLPRHTLAVGDRLETDILGGQRIGCLTALVLSGISTSEQASHWTPQPDIIIRDLTSLLWSK